MNLLLHDLAAAIERSALDDRDDGLDPRLDRSDVLLVPERWQRTSTTTSARSGPDPYRLVSRFPE